MDIQTRKLNLIQEFLQIPSEDFIMSLEQQVREYRKDVFARQLKAEVELALQESEDDEVISAEELREEIKSWN